MRDHSELSLRKQFQNSYLISSRLLTVVPTFWDFATFSKDSLAILSAAYNLIQLCFFFYEVEQ
jgi:hypothetical protein